MNEQSSTSAISVDDFLEQVPGLKKRFADDPELDRLFRQLAAANPLVVQAEIKHHAQDAERLLKHREWLVTTGNEISNTLDRTILTLATGSIALSVAFIEKLSPAPGAVRWLAASWGLMVACVVLIVSSIATCTFAIRHEIRETDALIARPTLLFLQPLFPGNVRKLSRLNAITIVLTLLGGLAFGSGLLAMVGFGVTTLQARGASMPPQDRPAGSTIEKGFVVPPPPPSPGSGIAGPTASPPPSQPARPAPPPPASDTSGGAGSAKPG